jgi:oligopeptide transport system substrate-binding protein
MAHMLDRRAFLSSASAAGLLIVAGCGQPNSASNSKGGGANIVAGVFNRGNAAEPGTLDPHLAQGVWEDTIIGDMLMGLTTESAKGEPVPGAAEKWESSADGKTWTFHLRDHQWSDGKPVTAGDFVFAWRRILDPKTASQYAYYLYLIKNAEAVNTGKMPGTALGISAPDDKTVVVELEHPAPFLAQYLTHYTTSPVPRHVVEEKGDAWSKPGNYVGNGAYTVTDWIPNDHVTLVKNPKFWDAENVKIERQIFYPTTDYEAALKRFRAGELDTQDRLPSLEIDWLRANMPETLHLDPILVTEYVSMNQMRKPFDDIRVREALNLAIDREILTSKVIKVGDIPAYGVVPPGIANYPGGNSFPFKSTPQPERLKRAQMLMQQAGYGPDKHLKTTLAIRSASADALRIPAAMQAMLKSAYVDIEIVQFDAAIFYAKMQQSDFDLGLAAWSADFNDSTTFLDMLKKGNANNYGHYYNAKYDGLMDQAAGEADLMKRGALLAQAEDIALKDFAWMPTYFWVSGHLVRPYVKGWEANARDQHRTRWLSLDEAARSATLRA